jgi:ferredoxin
MAHAWRKKASRQQLSATGWVIPESTRCVQCGICSFYCPIEIDVRRHAWLGEAVKDSYCITCGECVARCPRGVLSFGESSLSRLGRGRS